MMKNVFVPCENYSPMSVLQCDYIWCFNSPQTVMKSFFEYMFGKIGIYREWRDDPIVTVVCTDEICITVCNAYKLMYNSANATMYFYNGFDCQWYYCEDCGFVSDNDIYQSIKSIMEQ